MRVTTPKKQRSRDITRIIGEVAAKVHSGLSVVYTDYNGVPCHEFEPKISYVFGNTRYIKAHLDEMSVGAYRDDEKLPLIALFTPIVEDRGTPDYALVAKVNILIACKTSREWSNEQRRELSFDNVLKPIYNRFIEELQADGRLDFGYAGSMRHSYSENYSYGKYGAFTASGEEVSEPIDAIDIRNLELKVKHQNCRIQ